MTRLSRNFFAHEFECKCGCGANAVAPALIVLLEWLREDFNSPITINSGRRCHDYNEKIGGAFNSQHKYGNAADIVVSGVSPSAVANWLDACPLSGHIGLGRYDTFTHLDVRGHRARW